MLKLLVRNAPAHAGDSRGGLARFLLVGLVAIGVPAPAAASDWESLEPRKAADLLPAEKLTGEHYKIGDAVETDGFLNFYDLQTDFGAFSADSNWELEIRLLEVEAMAELAKVTNSKAITEAVGSAVMAPVDAAVDLVTDPMGAVKSIGRGVGNLFKSTKRLAKEVTAKKEKTEETAEQTQGAQGEKQKTEETAEQTQGAQGEKQKTEEMSTADLVLGTDKQLRFSAYKLRIDPYTDNEVLAAELYRVAKASAVGGGSVRLQTFDQMDGGLPGVSKDVYILHLKDLRVRNEKILTDAGFSAESFDAFEPFFESPSLSPTLRTILLDKFALLEGVEGREELIAMAAAMQSVDEARFQIGHAEFLAAFHQQTTPLAAIRGGAAFPAAVTRDGETFLVIAADHLSWTQALASSLEPRLERLTAATGDKMIDLWVAGDATPRAVEGLAAIGARLRSSEF